MIVAEIIRVGFKYIAKTNSGYTALTILRLIPSSLVIRQGGTTQPSPITFPVSFASKCLTVVPQLQAPGDSANMSKNRVCVTNLTARGFGLEYPQSAYNYIAIGI